MRTKMVKLRLDRCEIAENVRMIEFQVIQDRGPWLVVNELRTLVAEGGVVFVGFDHEEGGVAQACGNAEIEWHAANQEAGGQVGIFQYPGQHRSRRRLAVRAGDAKDPAALQHIFRQPLRARDIGQALVENGFEQRVAARNRVADDKNIGLQSHLTGCEAFDQLDAGRAQLVAHRRVDIGVAAGHLVATSHGQLRDAAHEGAADTQNMNVHVT